MEYHFLLSMFSKIGSKTLHPYRKYNHQINLKEGKEPPFGSPNGMGREELHVMKKNLEEHLKKDFIEASSSPASAPVLIIKEPGKGLRFCVDYLGLNEFLIKNRYRLPVIQATLDRLTKAQWYTKLDLTHAYNLVWIPKGNEWKTGFFISLGHYQYKVIPFGLCNTPATFPGLHQRYPMWLPRHLLPRIYRQHSNVQWHPRSTMEARPINYEIL